MREHGRDVECDACVQHSEHGDGRETVTIELSADASAPDAHAVVVLIELLDGVSGDEGIRPLEPHAQLTCSQHAVDRVVPFTHARGCVRRDRQGPGLTVHRAFPGKWVPRDEHERDNDGQPQTLHLSLPTNLRMAIPPDPGCSCWNHRSADGRLARSGPKCSETARGCLFRIAQREWRETHTSRTGANEVSCVNSWQGDPRANAACDIDRHTKR